AEDEPANAGGEAKSAKSEGDAEATTSSPKSDDSSASAASKDDDSSASTKDTRESAAAGKPKDAGFSPKWLAAGAAIVVAIIAAVLLSSGQGGRSPKRELPDLQISAADQALLLEHARAALEGRPPTQLPPTVAKICGRHV